MDMDLDKKESAVYFVVAAIPFAIYLLLAFIFHNFVKYNDTFVPGSMFALGTVMILLGAVSVFFEHFEKTPPIVKVILHYGLPVLGIVAGLIACLYTIGYYNERKTPSMFIDSLFCNIPIWSGFLYPFLFPKFANRGKAIFLAPAVFLVGLVIGAIGAIMGYFLHPFWIAWPTFILVTALIVGYIVMLYKKAQSAYDRANPKPVRTPTYTFSGSSSSSRGSAESAARSVSFVSAVTARADVYISHYRQSDSGHTVTVEFELQNTAGDIELTQSDVNALQEAACDQIAAKIQDQLPDYDVNISCVGVS
jgi:hypothetical protein